MHYNYESLESDDLGFTEKIYKEQSKVEKHLLVEDLRSFEAWCRSQSSSDSTLFFQFFSDAIVGAYARYTESKKRAWSPAGIFIAHVSAVLIPVLSGVLVYLFSDNNLLSTGSISLSIGIFLASLWLLMSIYQKLQGKRSYDETWVRHSICYNRLHLALSSFLTSPRTEEDYKLLVTDVFAILNQNLDQFAMNLSAHGMATRFNAD